VLYEEQLNRHWAATVYQHRATGLQTYRPTELQGYRNAHSPSHIHHTARRAQNTQSPWHIPQNTGHREATAHRTPVVFEPRLCSSTRGQGHGLPLAVLKHAHDTVFLHTHRPPRGRRGITGTYSTAQERQPPCH
jgi:hypothetical protein